jgi:spore coat polysaccharide biosynthesis protein SpsF
MSSRTPTVAALLQARMTSSRLPAKVLKPILGEPMLARQIERVKRARRIDRLIVATSDDPADDPIEALSREAGIDCHRGSLNDVLDRMMKAARTCSPDWVVRLTGDCPLADAGVIDAAIALALEGGYDYVTNAVEPTFPDGLDVEVVRADVLETAWREAVLTSEREHVTPFIHKRPQRFKIGHLRHDVDLSHLRWTVDEPDDFELVTRIYERLYLQNPAFAWGEVLELIEREPELANYNTSHIRNEGYLKSLDRDGP